MYHLCITMNTCVKFEVKNHFPVLQMSDGERQVDLQVCEIYCNLKNTLYFRVKTIKQSIGNRLNTATLDHVRKNQTFTISFSMNICNFKKIYSL